jgi:hypothetical protein
LGLRRAGWRRVRRGRRHAEAHAIWQYHRSALAEAPAIGMSCAAVGAAAVYYSRGPRVWLNRPKRGDGRLFSGGSAMCGTHIRDCRTISWIATRPSGVRRTGGRLPSLEKASTCRSSSWTAISRPADLWRFALSSIGQARWPWPRRGQPRSSLALECGGPACRRLDCARR